MGLFGSNKKEEAKKDMVPQLPSLPKLPDFPTMEDEMMQIHELPSLPSNYLGTKFSQNTIKDAVTGEEEVDADDFADDDRRMMQEPLKRPMTEEMGYQRFNPSPRSSMERGMSSPVFIRLDRFEEAMAVFGSIKRKISEIESTLDEIKRIREKEEGELGGWEAEIRSMKNQIEKVDRDIFSKL